MSKSQKSLIPRTKQEIREFGERMQKYSKCTTALFNDEPRLLEEYPNEWVAYYDEKLCAHSKNHDEMVAQLREKGIPYGETAVKLMDTNPRPLFY